MDSIHDLIKALRAKQGEFTVALERLRAAQVEHIATIRAFGSAQAAEAQAKQDEANVLKRLNEAVSETHAAIERLRALAAFDSALLSGAPLQHPEQEVIEEARALLTAYCGGTCDLTVDEARVILLRDTDGQDFSCDAAPLRAKLQPLVDGFLRNLLRGDGLLVCPRGLTFCLLSSVGRETAAIGKLYSGPARLITGEQVLVDGFEVLGVLFGVQLISQGEHGLQLKLRQQLGDELSKVIREAQAAGRRY